MTDEAENPRVVIGGNNPPISEVLADTYKAVIAEVDPIRERANALATEFKDADGKYVPGVIRTDEQMAKVADLVIDADTLSKRLEADRKKEKQPYLDGGREVDGFFGDFMAKLCKIADTFTEIASDHQRAVAAQKRREAEAEADRLRAEEEKLRAQADAAKKPATAEKKQDQADEIAAKADAAEARAATSNHDLAKMQTASGVKVGAATEWTFKITDYEAIPLDKLRPYLKREEIEKAIKSYVKIHKAAASLAGVHFEEDVKARIRR